MYSTLHDLRTHGYKAEVCAWDAITDDKDEDDQINSVKYSDNLTFMHLKVRSIKFCKQAIGYGDFRTKMLCATSGYQGEIITQVIIV